MHFGRQAEQYALDSLPLQQATQDDNARIAMVAMAVRMYRTHQAVCKLVDGNLNDAAGAVLRSLFEQYFVLLAVLNDPKSLDVAVEEAMSERRKALQGLRRMHPSERGPEITDAALDAAIAAIKAKKDYNVYEWARKSGCLGVYHTIWRRLCTYSHGCLLAIEDYVDVSSSGVVHGIKSVVERTASIDFVITSGGLLLEAVKAIDKAPSTELQRKRYEILQANFAGLRERYWALSGTDVDALL